MLLGSQLPRVVHSLFFFNDTATTEIYTLSLHDALPILEGQALQQTGGDVGAGSPPRGLSNPFSWGCCETGDEETGGGDRKSTRLNSSHANISYAVFCLKKKKYPPASTLHLYSRPAHHHS